MSYRNTSSSYGSVAKFFHWLIFLFILCMIIFGFLLSYVPKEYQAMAYNTHKLNGLVILFLMILRALWASINPKPLMPFNTPYWEILLERGFHYFLYIIILAMPIAGWVGSSAADKAPHLGSFKLALPINQDKALVQASFDVHNTLAIIIIIAVTLHILAALYHHFIKKDNVLRRMMPGSSRTY